GQTATQLLGRAESRVNPRVLFHYFGPQLQAVREGKWKLFLQIGELPEKRLASLWFTHQPELFSRQHRLWPKPTLYDLANDVGETTDVSAEYPEIVQRLNDMARSFDA